MEKEQILSEMIAKIGKTSLSQRTISGYVEGNLPADGVEPDDAYWQKHVDFLKSLDGNFSHDVASEVEKFKKNYKADGSGGSDGGSNSGSNGYSGNTGGHDDTILKRLEAMEERFMESENQAKKERIRKEVSDKAESLKVSNKALWKDAVMMVELNDDTDAVKLLEETKKVYEKKLKSYIGEGAAPFGGTQKQAGVPQDTEEAKAKREAFKARMAGMGRLPKREK
ncbi:hypothetical protein [Paraprevotella xylaniphila]